LSPRESRFVRMMGHRQPAVSKTLLIVDDQLLVAQGLACVLRNQAPDWQCAATASCEAAIREARWLRPDVVLMDPLLSDDFRFQSIRRFAAAHPSARLVFLDDRFRPALLRLAILMRVCGYWTKHSEPEAIVGAMQIAAQGEWTACPEAEPYVVHTRGRVRFRRMGEKVLTPRELAVVRLLSQGLSVKECAKHLRISPNTVDNHKSRLMKKLGLHRLGALMLWAVREGLA
jgi:DNA-binding NarL/FixJ family response regulator